MKNKIVFLLSAIVFFFGMNFVYAQEENILESGNELDEVQSNDTSQQKESSEDDNSDNKEETAEVQSNDTSKQEESIEKNNSNNEEESNEVIINRDGEGTEEEEEGDVPEHEKNLTDNKDGTYTLELTVTGESEKQVNKVNVIVILDVSGSMDSNTGNTEVIYTPTNSTSIGLYGLIDGEYVPLARRGNRWNRTFWYNNVQYTGQRYTRTVGNQSRLEAAQNAVNNLAESLLANNGIDGNPEDMVQISMITFANTGSINQQPTTDFDTFQATVDRLNANGGTNWESALQQVSNVNFGDNDTTYVIFVSDGAPTFHSSDGGYNNYNRDYRVYGSGREEEPNMERSYTQAEDDAINVANSVGTKNFYTIFAYGTRVGASYMSSLATAAGIPSGNNYDASDTVGLQTALQEILDAIETAGFGQVEINDGTTDKVTTSTGVSHLLDVDTNSFTYYKDGVEWKVEDGAPEATLNEDGEVVWNLSSLGILENGVTYSVKFRVWPSQETLDLIADLKNDPSIYEGLDTNIKKYLIKDGDGYTLKTNTVATLSFIDTRPNGTQDGSTTYINPDPVNTMATEMLAITKEWDNDLDERPETPITIKVLKDGDDWEEIELNESNGFKGNKYIAIGIMTTDENGETQLLAAGHDYSFGELGEDVWNWELKSDIIRPMLINGQLTILIKEESQPEGTKGIDWFLINGAYYSKGTIEESTATLTATNERRSWIDITKTVNYDEGFATYDDQIFTFQITVDDKNGDDVWFSIKESADSDSNFVFEENGLVVTVATAEIKNGVLTGYFSVASGTQFTVGMKAGWNLRIINLLKGSTYTIEEINIDPKFQFIEIKATNTDPDNYEPTINGKVVEGEIKNANVQYDYEYINKNVQTTIIVTKVWEDNNDEYKNRDDIILHLVGTKEEAQPSKVDNGDGTWTYTYENLAVYDENGDPITYTLTEDGIAGYTTTVKGDQKDGFIVTNTLDVISVTVVKVWDDKDDQDGLRPENITITLSDGQTVTLNETNKWTQTLENLPEYKNKAKVTYSWSETSVPTGYEISGNETEGTVTTITNKHTPEVITLTVTKVWDDKDDQDGLRPESITITLSNGNTVTLNEDNDWTATISDLPKYSAGSEIKYSWSEANVPTGYEISKNETEGLVTTIINKHVPEVINIIVTKVWDDNNNENGARPESITVTLYVNGDGVQTVTLNEENSWTYTFEGLDKNALGTAIEYNVDENELELYDKAITGDAENGFTITNTYNCPTGDEEEPIEEPEESTNPHTADHITTYVGMFLFSILTLIGTTYCLVKNN